jgi:hypothetical protein
MGATAEYDYGDPEGPLSSTTLYGSTGTAVGVAAIWDIAEWDEAPWSASMVESRLAQLDGKGRNILFSMTGQSINTDPHSITAVTFNVIYRGVARAE